MCFIILKLTIRKIHKQLPNDRQFKKAERCVYVCCDYAYFLSYMCSYRTQCNLKVKKELSNELMHIYVENTLRIHLKVSCVQESAFLVCMCLCAQLMCVCNTAEREDGTSISVSVKMTHLLTGSCYVYVHVFVFVCIDSM